MQKRTSMTDREQRMIEAYIPSPRDESLDFDEYYVKDNAGRVHRVHFREIYPHKEDTFYSVYTDGGKHIKCWLDELGGFPMAYLYDNYDDCKNDTHSLYNNWEYLRELQEKEA